MLVLLVYPSLTTEPAMREHAWRWTHPLGGGAGISHASFWELSERLKKVVTQS